MTDDCKWRGILKSISQDIAVDEVAGEKLGRALGDKAGPLLGFPVGLVEGFAVGAAAGAEVYGKEGYRNTGVVGAAIGGTIGAAVLAPVGSAMMAYAGLIESGEVVAGAGDQVGQAYGAIRGTVRAASKCAGDGMTRLKQFLSPKF